MYDERMRSQRRKITGFAADITSFGRRLGFCICALFIFAPGDASADVRQASSAVPVLVLLTDGQPIVDRARAPISLEVISDLQTSDTEGSGIEHQGRAELSVRGNTSYYFQKKSYRLELQNESGHDTKAPLLGMPADSDWVLY